MQDACNYTILIAAPFLTGPSETPKPPQCAYRKVEDPPHVLSRGQDGGEGNLGDPQDRRFGGGTEPPTHLLPMVVAE